MIRMTLEDLKAIKDDFLSASTVASVLKMDTGRLIGYAKDGQLPFPVVISGNRVKIPRLAFLKQYGLIEEEHERDDRLDKILKELHSVNVALTVLNAVALGIMKHMAPEEYKQVNQAFSEGGTAQ